MWVTASNLKLFMSSDTVSTYTNTFQSASNMASNLMSHIVSTYSNKSIKLYVNGNCTDANANPSSLVLATASNNAHVYSPDGFYAQSNIDMNRLWVYPYAMSDSQVSNFFVSELFKVSTVAYDVALYGGGPWGALSGWTDTTARWLWASSDYANDPSNYALFYCSYNNTTGSTMTNCTLKTTCDNEITVYLNKTLLGTGTDWTTASTYTVSLNTGINLFQMVCKNVSLGPTGLIFSLTNGIGTVILRSDQTASVPLTNSSFTYFSQYGTIQPITY
jgi:hypothetical protein